jgi:predicted nucleotidyltransferase
MEFSKLRKLLDDKVINQAIDNLLELKTASDEKKYIEPIPVLHDFISEKIAFCEANLPEANEIRQNNHLDELFRTQLYDVHSNP